MKIYPELNKSNCNKDDFTLDCNAWLHTLKGVVSRQAVSLSQPSATHYNTGAHMLSKGGGDYPGIGLLEPFLEGHWENYGGLAFVSQVPW